LLTTSWTASALNSSGMFRLLISHLSWRIIPFRGVQVH
jgi:hypothetical protein